MVKLFYNLTQESQQTDFLQLTKNAGVCVVCFSAVWCGPCKRLGAELHNKLADVLESDKDPSDYASFGDSVVLVKVDLDVFDELGKLYEVESIPHIVFYKDGELQKDVIKGCQSDRIVERVGELRGKHGTMFS